MSTRGNCPRAAWSARRTSPARLGAALAAALIAAPVPAGAETLLRFSETATVSAQPDELAATVQAVASAGTATEAQAEVNRRSAAALEEAAHVPGVVASTGPYRVWHPTEPPSRPGQAPDRPQPSWQASQTVFLHSHDGPSLLALVGRLQQSGLTLDGLDWRLSEKTARRLHEEAQRQALQHLRARAEEAAGLLGLRFGSFKDVQLETPHPFAPMMRQTMALAAAPGPVAQSEAITVTATVQAEAILEPR